MLNAFESGSSMQCVALHSSRNESTADAKRTFRTTCFQCAPPLLPKTEMHQSVVEFALKSAWWAIRRQAAAADRQRATLAAIGRARGRMQTKADDRRGCPGRLCRRRRRPHASRQLCKRSSKGDTWTLKGTKKAHFNHLCALLPVDCCHDVSMSGSFNLGVFTSN
jgi:hypothetical protein